MIETRTAIGIAGAGLLGRLLAWRLQRAGHRVLLADAHPIEQSPAAAFTAAGMVAPLSELVASERLVYELGMKSLALWPQWLALLDASELFTANGSLVVAHAHDRAELNQFQLDLRRRLGGESEQWRSLGQRQIAHLEPALAQFHQGVFLTSEGHLDNRRTLQKLLHRFQHDGGALAAPCPVEFDNGQLCNHSADALRCFWPGDLPVHWIDVRGRWAKPALPGLRGVRGEVLRVQTRALTLQRPVRLMHPRYQLYIVPQPDHTFVIGATQIESEDLSPVSVQSTLELASALYTVHPAFGEARILESATNLRPALPDNLPTVRGDGQVLAVNGLFRHGYLLAPALVEQVELLLARDTWPEGSQPLNLHPQNPCQLHPQGMPN